MRPCGRVRVEGLLESALADDLLMFFALEVILLFTNRVLPESEGRVP
jgi:hypothetical protein